MRLSEEVTVGDVDEAIRLVRSALQQAAIDPKTGLIDMDLITTGKSADHRKRMRELADAITPLFQDKPKWFFNIIFKEIQARSSRVKRKKKKLEKKISN